MFITLKQRVCNVEITHSSGCDALTCGVTQTLPSGQPAVLPSGSLGDVSSNRFQTSHSCNDAGSDLRKQSLHSRDLTTEPNRRSVLGVRPTQQDREGRARTSHGVRAEWRGCDHAMILRVSVTRLVRPNLVRRMLQKTITARRDNRARKGRCEGGNPA